MYLENAENWLWLWPTNRIPQISWNALQHLQFIYHEHSLTLTQKTSPSSTLSCMWILWLDTFMCYNFLPPVNCSDPTPPMDGSIASYQNTTEGAEISFMCNQMFVPTERMTAMCGADQRWSPDPAGHRCTCEYSSTVHVCLCRHHVHCMHIYTYILLRGLLMPLTKIFFKLICVAINNLKYGRTGNFHCKNIFVVHVS